MAVPDDRRRAALIAQLADLPIQMADVATMRNQRKRIEQAGTDVEVWKARQRIDWAKRFRAHYANVARAAWEGR